MISMRLHLIANPCLPAKFDKLFLIFHNNIRHVISFHFGHFRIISLQLPLGGGGGIYFIVASTI